MLLFCCSSISNMTFSTLVPLSEQTIQKIFGQMYTTTTSMNKNKTNWKLKTSVQTNISERNWTEMNMHQVCYSGYFSRIRDCLCMSLVFFSLLFSFSLPHSVLAFSDRLLKPNIHTIKYLFNADFSLVSMRPHTAKIRSNTSKCLCCSPKTLSFQQFKNSFVSL